MSNKGGQKFAADGRLIVTAAGISPGPAFNAAWAFRQQDGAGYIADLAAAAVPGTAKFVGALAFSQAGALQCTTNTAGPFTSVNSMKVRSDGALFILAASPGVGDVFVGGWGFKGGAGATAGAALIQLKVNDVLSLLSVQTLTATNAALTPPAGATAALMECWGGGGGSAGLAAAAGSQEAISQAGGGGAYSAAFLSSIVAGNFNCTVGAGGTGGSAGANDGLNGGDTSVVDSGATTRCLAKGGTKGATASTLATGVSLAFGPAGGAGGLASAGTGDIKIDGGSAPPGLRQSGTLGIAGPGGNAALAGEGGVPVPTNSAGVAASAGSIGAGASGAIDSAATARAGGAGIIGLIRIWWFIG